MNLITLYILHTHNNKCQENDWSLFDKEALDFHIKGKSGKIEINSSKPLTTKRDLSLAYSPGVVASVKEIAKDPELAYDYEQRKFSIISNGSAILGLGKGSLAQKPVMEGKSCFVLKDLLIDLLILKLIVITLVQ